jgi:hypothetical protein
MTIEAERVVDGAICIVRARGHSTLVEVVDFVRRSIDYCRADRVGKLLVNVTDVAGVPMPSLVDRFLAAEEWAVAADGAVVVALVVDGAYIDPQRFGVKAAGHFGLRSEPFTREDDALEWLERHA